MQTHPEIYQRDDGRFALGWGDDAPGPFESRGHAEAVAAWMVARTGKPSETAPAQRARR
jgi:hypothetical protein